jgi:hypothetical protein
VPLGDREGDLERVEVDDRDDRPADLDEIPDVRLARAGHAVERCPDRRVRQPGPLAGERRLSLGELGLGLLQVRPDPVGALARDQVALARQPISAWASSAAPLDFGLDLIVGLSGYQVPGQQVAARSGPGGGSASAASWRTAPPACGPRLGQG